MSNKNLIERIRSFEIDHTPDGWPAIRMRDISALADALEAADNRIEELRYVERETFEQAKLLGMSAEREADLLGKLERAERKLSIARDALKQMASVSILLHGERRIELAKETLEQIGN